MTDDCIHGLVAELCDQCTPKVVPVVSGTTSPSLTRSRSPRRKPPSRRAPLLSEKATTVDPGTKRIFHVTHLRNLPGILSAGCIQADARGALPVVDLSSVENRARRRAAAVSSGESVASFVPFFLVPHAELWAGALAGAADERLAPAAQKLPAGEFVMLVSTMGQIAKSELASGGVVLADDDAAATVARFTVVDGKAVRLPRLDEGRELVAELLVQDSFPMGSISLVGVANDKARGQVRELLRASEFSPKIAVYPPWFQPVEPD